MGIDGIAFHDVASVASVRFVIQKTSVVAKSVPARCQASLSENRGPMRATNSLTCLASAPVTTYGCPSLARKSLHQASTIAVWFLAFRSSTSLRTATALPGERAERARGGAAGFWFFPLCSVEEESEEESESEGGWSVR